MPSGGGGGAGTTPEDVKAAKALAAQIEAVYPNAVGHIFDGKTVLLIADITIPKPATASIQIAPPDGITALSVSRAAADLSELAIPSGVTFIVREKVTLTVAETGTFTTNGAVPVESGGAFTTSGAVTVAGGGSLEVTGGTVAVSSGTVNVASSGTVTVAESQSITVNGTPEAAEGGAVNGAGGLTGTGTVKGEGAVTVAIDTELDMEELKELIKVDTVNGLSDALTEAKAETDPEDRVIYLTGAFYFAPRKAARPGFLSPAKPPSYPILAGA